jgi:outer membrane protein assembly factor BamB/tetratricopeptide (TPR) repeat protein
MTSLKGSLNSVDLANIFQMLSLNQREGTLYIFEGASRKAICFGAGGVSMLSKGRTKSDALGRILLRYDKVKPEALAAALDKRQESGRLLGQVLVEEGVCTRADIDEALQIQIQEEVYSLFIWKDAQFEFVEGEPEEEFRAEGVQKLGFNVNSVIMEAAKRVDEWAWIQGVVPDLAEIFRYSGTNVDLTDSIFQEPYAGKVLAAVDGKRSVEEVIDASFVNKFEVCKILALLLEGGAIEKLPTAELKAESEAAAAAGDTAGAVKFLSRLVAVGGDEPEMHKKLAEAFESERELEKAAFHYRVYAEVCADRRDVKEAFLIYKRICDFLPTDLAACDRMIEVFASNPDGLEEHAKEIVERGKQLAEIYVELKRSSRAVQVLHRVVSLGPDDADLRNRLISVYLASGMPGEAIAEFEALADASIAAKDYENAEKIFRKILSIDRSRGEVAARLDQIVSKKRRRAQNVRNLAVGAVVIAAASIGAWYGLTWFKEKKAEQAQREVESMERCESARAAALPVISDLDGVLKDLSNRPVDLTVLAKSLSEKQQRIAELEKRVATVVAGLADVKKQFPGLPAEEDAANLEGQVEGKMSAIKKKVAEIQKYLRENAEALHEQAGQTLADGGATRAALEKLEGAVKIAEDCEGWSVSEKGQACLELRQQLRQYLKEFDDTKSAIEKKVKDEDFDGAFELSIAYLTNKNFPPRDLREDLPLPVRVFTTPCGAHVMTKDGVDAGLLTGPNCVVMISLLKGGAFDVELAGFNKASLVIPGVRDVDAVTVLQKIKRVYQVPLEKTQVFRKGTTDGKPVTAAPLATARWMVIPGTKTLDVVDLRSGKIANTILCDRGVRARGAIVPREGEDATVAIPTSEGSILFYDVATAKSRGGWTGARGGIATDLAVVGGDVIAADERGTLWCVNVATHEKRWEHATASANGAGVPVTTPPLVAQDDKHGTVAWYGCDDGSVRAVSMQDGREVRRITLVESDVGRVVASLAVEPGYVLFANRDAAGSKQTRVTKWSLAADRAEWSVTVAGDVRGAPMPRGGSVFVVTSGGEIVALRAVDGTRTSATAVDRNVKVSGEPVLEGDLMYVGCDNGFLYAFDVRDREPQTAWKYPVKTGAGKPVSVTTRCVFAGGYILFGAADNAVYALEGDPK